MSKIPDQLSRLIFYLSGLTPSRLFGILSSYTRKIGVQASYVLLLLYYSFRSERTPTWAKRTILGAFAYLLSPVDFIPDLTPVIGFSDDIEFMMFSLITIACYIDTEVRKSARQKLHEWFEGGIPNRVVEDIDAKL